LPYGSFSFRRITGMAGAEACAASPACRSAHLHLLREAPVELGLHQRRHFDAVESQPVDDPGDVSIAQPPIGDSRALEVRAVQPGLAARSCMPRSG
jgi:hypothetical protein